MDTRLAIPLILLAGALALASGVERSLVSELEPFRVEGGELATLLAFGGLPGVEPGVQWVDAPAAAQFFVVVGEDLDGAIGDEIFWVESSDESVRDFRAPGLDALMGRRLRVRVHALSAPLALSPDLSPSELAREASARSLSTATWFAGGGWFQSPTSR